MPNGICFQFDPSYHAVMVLLVLEANLFLPIPQVPLFEVDTASCQRLGFPSCSGCFTHLRPDLYTKGAQDLQLWNSCQLPWPAVVMNRDGAQLPWSKSGPLYRSCRSEKLSCKFVGRHQFSRSNPALCQVWEALVAGILIVDLPFYGQWNLPPVRHQLPCSDGFACLGSRCSSLANRIGAAV